MTGTKSNAWYCGLVWVCVCVCVGRVWGKWYWEVPGILLSNNEDEHWSGLPVDNDMKEEDDDDDDKGGFWSVVDCECI